MASILAMSKCASSGVVPAIHHGRRAYCAIVDKIKVGGIVAPNAQIVRVRILVLDAR